ncbi:MAG: dihydrolipoyl dehydrogenase [Thermodesulfobacteriota bacterium]
MKINNKLYFKIILVLVIAAAFFSFKIFVPGEYLTLSYIKSIHTDLVSFYLENKLISIAGFGGVYIIMAALSLPGATVMTLAGASVMGFWTGLIVISFASSIGAYLAFLSSRFVLRDFVNKKYSEKIKKINQGIKKDGVFYLLTLRLIPVFPFFIINLAMGLTSIKASSYYIVSQLGMLPGTAVYVNAGTQLGDITSTGSIITLPLLLSFALLGIFPWMAKFFISILKTRKALSGYSKPKKFDYNLIVIGGGSAGLVSSYIASTVKSKVCLIEKNKMGGDCLNTGCVPSKALIKSAEIMNYSKTSEKYGIKSMNAELNFSDIMTRIHKIIKKIEPNDSVERYTDLGVDCMHGCAEIISPYEVKIDSGKILSSKNIIIATGASPFIPDIKGLEKIKYLTSENLWELDYLPQKLCVLGGGPIGCELAQAFSRLGSKVSIVEMSSKIMGKEDDDVSDFISDVFKNEGIDLFLNHKAEEIKLNNGNKFISASINGENKDIEFDEIIVAVGRKANTKGFGLENINIELNDNKTIKVNEFLQTNIPTIFCAGDVAGPYQFTHAAAHQAWFASVNSLFGKLKKFKTDYSLIPWATYTDPEVARAGLSENEAKEQNIEYDLTIYNLADLDRAVTDSADSGFVKVITKKGKDRILGVSITGKNASSVIAEFVLAMKYKIGLNKILKTIHIYPTYSEAVKSTAGEWKKSNKPEKIINLLEKYHKFMRG